SRVPLLYGVEGGVDGCRVPDVDDVRLGSESALLPLRDSRFELGAIEVEGDHRRALLEEGRRDGPADTAGGSRHDGDVVGELGHGQSPSYSMVPSAATPEGRPDCECETPMLIHDDAEAPG